MDETGDLVADSQSINKLDNFFCQFHFTDLYGNVLDLLSGCGAPAGKECVRLTNRNDLTDETTTIQNLTNLTTDEVNERKDLLAHEVHFTVVSHESSLTHIPGSTPNYDNL